MNCRRLLLKILLFLLCTGGISCYSQSNCNCDALSVNTKDNLNEKDSSSVFSMTKILLKSKNSSCVFEGLSLEFDYYIRNRQTEKAIRLLKMQEKLLSKMDCKASFSYAINSNWAYYYHVTNDLEKLSVYAFKALKESNNLNDDSKKISAIQQVVYLFTKMNEHEKNWPYIRQAQQLIVVQPMNKKTAENYRWLAFEYEQKYTLTERKTLIDSSLLFANRAKQIAFKFKMYDEITNLYRVKESCAYHKGDIKNALVFIDSAIFFAKKIEGYKNLAPLYSAKAWDHLDSGQLDDANKWMDTALVMAKGIKDSSGKMMMYFDASNLYKEAGKTDKAFESFKVYTQMKDSVWNMEKVEKVNELEQKYNKVKNEKTIFELEKTKQRYTFFIILSVLVLLVLIFFFRYRTLQNRQVILQTEQRLNRARINPHFFFNAMAALQNISMAEKSPNTTLFISRFARIMRQSLESTYEELVTIETEIDFIRDYIEIQKLRFPDKFDYTITVDDDLEIDALKVPGMIIQPFVENSIEHGFKDILYKGMIEISFKDTKNYVDISIRDNGRGVNPEEKKNHTSRALQISRERLDLLNRQNHTAGFFKIVDVEKNGFEIHISLPKLN